MMETGYGGKYRRRHRVYCTYSLPNLDRTQPQTPSKGSAHYDPDFGSS